LKDYVKATQVSGDHSLYKTCLMKKIVRFALILVSCNSLAQSNAPYAGAPTMASSSRSITENRGQVCDQNRSLRPDVLYYGSTPGFNYYLKNDGVSYQLQTKTSQKQIPGNTKHSNAAMSVVNYGIYRVDVNWVGTNKDVIVSAAGAQKEQTNYYLPQCPKGVTQVNKYDNITFNSLYHDIDLKYYFNEGGSLEYDFIVKPKADYRQIVLDISGATRILKNDNGGITIETPLGNIEQGKPVVRQNEKMIEAAWVVNGTQLSYNIGTYDKEQTLTIDPVVLSWGTYMGDGEGASVAASHDAAGNVFIVGTTHSTGGMATSGAFLTSYIDSGDAFVAKFNAAGGLLWASYYGGISSDEAASCATDATGNIFISGDTYSYTGLATPGAHQAFCDSCTSVNGADDIFLAKFNSSGVLQWGTYYGGSGQEIFSTCAADASGNIYLSGTTASVSGISTSGSLREVCDGCVHPFTSSVSYDAFLVKFNSSGTVQWGTYFGNADVYGYNCAVDPSGNVYISGETFAAADVATPGAYQTTLAGDADAFLAKFSPAGALDWATYYGGVLQDKGLACTTDASGNAVLFGNTWSTTGIATTGAYQTICYSCITSGGEDAFIAKFSSSGTLLWGSYYGGDGNEEGNAVATDGGGNILISGLTTSNIGIATTGAYQLSCGGCAAGGTDGYLAMFQPAGGLLWGSYYGGNGFYDIPLGCTIGSAGNLYITGGTNSTTGIATTGAYDIICDLCASNSTAPFLARFNYTTTEVATVANETPFTIFPNPANDEINVKGNIPVNISIKNLLGSTVASAENTNHISVKTLPGGIYFIQLSTINGEPLNNEKIVKQ
jgi:hypothetical protein